MYNQYNLEGNIFDNLLAPYKEFLRAENISKGSARSYLSDARHFLNWLVDFLKENHRFSQITEYLPAGRQGFSQIRVNPQFTLSEEMHQKVRLEAEGISENQSIVLLKHVNEKVLNDYKVYLISNNVPLKTINRRFSSLRRFGAFCQSQQWLVKNSFDTLRNISKEQSFPEDKYHLGEFKVSLWQKNSSKSTLKNYLNDIKQFIEWENSLIKANRSESTLIPDQPTQSSRNSRSFADIRNNS